MRRGRLCQLATLNLLTLEAAELSTVRTFTASMVRNSSWESEPESLEALSSGISVADGRVCSRVGLFGGKEPVAQYAVYVL